MLYRKSCVSYEWVVPKPLISGHVFDPEKMHLSLLQSQDCWQHRGRTNPGVTYITLLKQPSPLYILVLQISILRQQMQNSHQPTMKHNYHSSWLLKHFKIYFRQKMCFLSYPSLCCSSHQCKFWFRKSWNVSLLSQMHLGLVNILNCSVSLHRQSPSSSRSSSMYLSWLSLSTSDDSRYQILFAQLDVDKYFIKCFQPW